MVETYLVLADVYKPNRFFCNCFFIIVVVWLLFYDGLTSIQNCTVYSGQAALIHG